MPNIKSAKKRARQSEERRKRNVSRKSAIKTSVKKVVVALEENNVEQAQVLMRDAEAKLSRAKNKGLFHANTVARKVSRLAKKIAAAKKEAE